MKRATLCTAHIWHWVNWRSAILSTAFTVFVTASDAVHVDVDVDVVVLCFRECYWWLALGLDLIAPCCERTMLYYACITYVCCGCACARRRQCTLNGQTITHSIITTTSSITFALSLVCAGLRYPVNPAAISDYAALDIANGHLLVRDSVRCWRSRSLHCHITTTTMYVWMHLLLQPTTLTRTGLVRNERKHWSDEWWICASVNCGNT